MQRYIFENKIDNEQFDCEIIIDNKYHKTPSTIFIYEDDLGYKIDYIAYVNDNNGEIQLKKTCSNKQEAINVAEGWIKDSLQTLYSAIPNIDFLSIMQKNIRTNTNESTRSLEELFDEKVSIIAEEKEKQKERKNEVNKVYAQAYLDIVSNVIEKMNTMDTYQNITINNKIFNYDNQNGNVISKESKAMLTNDSLKIRISFDVSKSVRIEKEYDESLINEMLEKYNIEVNHEEGNFFSQGNGDIIITYKRKRNFSKDNSIRYLKKNF